MNFTRVVSHGWDYEHHGRSYEHRVLNFSNHRRRMITIAFRRKMLRIDPHAWFEGSRLWRRLKWE